jgi:tRNA (guanine37-N1)-methyltransferase
MPKWNVTIITLFPEMFPGPLGYSLVGKALRNDVWRLDIIDLKEYGLGKHRQVDDEPYGGGAGMLLRADVLGKILDEIITKTPDNPPKIVYLSPKGRLFKQNTALEFTNHNNLVIICGRFEGVDERVLDYYNIEELSIGDFVLSGGEIAAFAVLDACVRLLPNVLGGDKTLLEESFSIDGSENLLEYPQYTRPANWKNLDVPDILLSGNHRKIKEWRLSESQNITKQRRKDLWDKYCKHDK